jgi:hypothetical protein
MAAVKDGAEELWLSQLEKGGFFWVGVWLQGSTIKQG